MHTLNRSSVVVAVLALVAAACSDVTGPTTSPDSAASVERIAAEPTATDLRTLEWNAIARGLVASRVVDPPMAARIYAMLSVAQYNATRAADRTAPGSSQARHAISAKASVIAASAAVLSNTFPLDAEAVRNTAKTDMVALLGGKNDSEALAAYAAGEAAAQHVIARSATDGSSAPWAGSVPVGEGLWYSSTTATALRPGWGSVRPWLMRSGDQFRPAPPPAFRSPEFKAALAEVRHISDTRTAEQLRTALYWSDGSGTVTPPGHWNVIAAGLIEDHHLTEEQATQTLALLNMALMDAGIACWDAKYHYWMIRPPQADPMIVTAVPLPNFPSYVSGHATFSGAAAELLGAVFPSERRKLSAMANEAAMSRLYGGIHYRFDNDAGLALGQTIGRLAAARLHGSSTAY